MENKKVFIGNLDFSATVAELESLLSKFGSIVSITLKQKKGCAFFEMEKAEDAARAVRELDGIKHKGREMRLSFYMEARKARIVSARTYKERGARFAGRKPGTPDVREPRRMKENHFTPNRPAPEGGKLRPARSSKVPPGYAPRERTPGSDRRPARAYSPDRSGPVRPAKKPWSADKPAYPRRPGRDGLKPVSRRPLKPDSGYTPRERMPGLDTRPARSYSPDSSGPPRPVKKQWSADKPSYPRRPAREAQGSGSTRQPKKEWSPQRPSRPSAGADTRSGAWPERNNRFGDTSRGPAKPRPQGAAPKRFSTSPRPGSGAGKRTPGSSKPKPRTHSAARSKPSARD